MLDFDPTVDPASHVWERFADRAECSALRTAESDLSYAALEVRVESLARALIAASGVPGSVVAIECTRGAHALIALLAVLRAKHVPLLASSSAPAERIEEFREAVGARISIRVTADGEWSVASSSAITGKAMERIAYITATSGTTSAPRVCRVDAGVFRAYTDDITAAYGLTGSDHVLQFAPPDFDVFIEESIPTLAAGGCVVVPPWAHAPAVPDFLGFVTEQAVSVINLPSSYWMAVAEHLRAAGASMPQTVRLVVIGSEQVARHLVEWWTASTSNPQLLNAYGIAELAPTCIVFDCDELPHTSADDGVVPIGRPLPFAVASISAPDEAGEGVGHLRLGLQPSLCPPGFIPLDSGDFASEDREGRLYIHGRADLSKLKRGGITVNVEAVAAAACQCDGILGAVPRIEHANGTFVLIVQSTEGSDSVARVEQHLRMAFPEAWLPDAILTADPTAQTAGAKLSSAATGRTPEADLESLIRAVWTEQLGNQVLDGDTDFFDAGGDSIAAVRTCFAVSRATDTNVAIQIIFAHSQLDRFVAAVQTLVASQ
jgi:acyl-coenzyme A synthetase/AMP-(fatty) acid ligase